MNGKKLLVVVDYQVDFVTGSLGFEGALALEDAICEKIRAYKRAGDEVVFTLDTHEQKYLFTNEGKHLPVKHCIKGTSGHKLYGKVGALSDGCTVIEKATFGGLGLAEHISRSDYSDIELCGVVSNICVLSNAVIAKAASPDSQIIVDAACVAAPDSQMHEKALDILRGLHVNIIE